MRGIKTLVCIALAAAVAALVPHQALSAQEDFTLWLSELKREAASQGISQKTLQEALSDLRPIERVIELDRSQPEFRRTAADYLARVVSERRIERGRQLFKEHRILLGEIAERYQVEPHVLVALWGIESDFGRLTGGFPVIDALATLAWEGRRGTFFRGQLLAALEILDQGHVSREGMVGSWAGAMGQVQFIPTTFRAYAVDFTGNGRRDIWNSTADALASAANYLNQSGWSYGRGWGQRVSLPGKFNTSLAGLDTRKTLDEWRRLGVKGVDGSGRIRASLVIPDGIEGPAFLVYDNFRIVMKWNRSVSFALAVGLLSDRIGEPE